MRPGIAFPAMEAKTATVVIAAGHGVVGEVARRACEAEPGIEVVAEVRDEVGLFDACRRIRPDVLVLDDRLDGGEPTLESLRAMREEGVSVAAVVLTDRADGAAVLEALRLGVRGYVRKSDGLPGIGAVVRRVADGERAVDPELEQAAVMALGRFAQQAREGSEVEASLTARELEILAMVSQWAHDATGGAAARHLPANGRDARREALSEARGPHARAGCGSRRPTRADRAVASLIPTPPSADRGG